MKRGGSCYTSDGEATTKARLRLRRDGAWHTRETASRRFVVTVHIDPAQPDQFVHQANACVFVQAPSPRGRRRDRRATSRTDGEWCVGPDVEHEVLARDEQWFRRGTKYAGCIEERKAAKETFASLADRNDARPRGPAYRS